MGTILFQLVDDAWEKPPSLFRRFKRGKEPRNDANDCRHEHYFPLSYDSVNSTVRLMRGFVFGHWHDLQKHSEIFEACNVASWPQNTKAAGQFSRVYPAVYNQLRRRGTFA